MAHSNTPTQTPTSPAALSPPAFSPRLPSSGPFSVSHSSSPSRSRPGSLASASVSSHLDKEQLALAFDKIHNSASQSHVLTTFNDYAPPPGSLPTSESKGAAGDLVQQGLSGLYSRFKEAVGAVGRPAAAHEADETGSQDAAPSRASDGTSIGPKPVSGPTPSSTFSMNSPSEKKPSSSAASAAAATTADSQGDGPQPSQTSFVSTPNAPKSSSSSVQNLPKLAKASVPNPSVAPASVAPVTVSAFSGARSVASAVDDAPARSARRSLSKPSDVVASGHDGAATGEKLVPGRARMDDSKAVDASSKSGSVSRAGSRVSSARDSPKKPVVIDRISPPGSRPAASTAPSSSGDPVTIEPSPISTSAHHSVDHESFARDEEPETLRSGETRIPGTTANEGAPEAVSARLELMRKQVLSKEFWMADETCKECFLCGTPFSAFRRKHHCRTCGCIFDSKCTSIIAGQKFGVQGSLRVCRTCLDVINRRYDSGSDASDDDSYLPAIFRSAPMRPPPANPARAAKDDDGSVSERADDADDARSTVTPMMAIPATRRIGQSSRRNAVLEIDTPQLSRPGSSRSLKSLSSGRPQSSGHKRHHSKHGNLLTKLKGSTDERAPFRRPAHLDDDGLGRKSKLPAFHDDNIIDPELAPYMSDESSGDEQMSIFSTMASSDPMQLSSLDPDRRDNSSNSNNNNLGSLLNATKRQHHHRFRPGEKSASALSFTSRGGGGGGGGGAGAGGGGGGGHEDSVGMQSPHPRPAGRRRNLSTASASVHHLRSPRPKSAIFKAGGAPSTSGEALLGSDAGGGGGGGTSDGQRNTGGHHKSTGSGDTSRSAAAAAAAARSPEAQLGPAALNHVKKLFRQLLEDSEIPDVAAWEKALLPVLIRCSDDVEPDIRNGDDIDIRHYVKLKKIPGGRPHDTSYVPGVVFTRNLALKSMPRRIAGGPRIVIVTFPIEYQRHPQQHFMSLQAVMEQEKEFLRMVVSRIAALKPRVLLAEKSVAGVALQYLSEAGVAVVSGVKASVVEAVSRCAQTEIISSLDMLALPVQVGCSGGFEVRTYVNAEIQGGKKTYVFVGGCDKVLGCTIVLRGAPSRVLARMKRITEFMVYVVYNLRLESCLMRDEYVHVPMELEEGSATTTTASLNTAPSLVTGGSSEPGPPTAAAATHHPGEGGGGEATTPATTPTSTSPTQPPDGPLPGPLPPAAPAATSTAHSTSDQLPSTAPDAPPPPPPPPLTSEAPQDPPSSSQLPDDVPMPTFYSDMVAKYRTRILSASPFVKFPQPYLLMNAREQERRLVHLKRLRDQDIVEHGEGDRNRPQRFQLVRPEMVHEMGQRAPRKVMEVLRAVHDAEYDKALHNYQTQTRQWENYIKGSLDLFDPYSHQNIVVLYSVICTETKIPCAEPSLVAMAFYDEHPDPSGPMDPDCTLGQYVEDLCTGAASICRANGCDRPMHRHHRTYVHDDARITVMVDKDAPLPPGAAAAAEARRKEKEANGDDDDDSAAAAAEIFMWNYCKLCRRDMGLNPMSTSAWKYSFGKYLELSFWSRGLRPTEEANCPHDHQKDHIRYFHHAGSAVRIHYDPVDLLEIVVPRTRITWKVANDLRLKNDTFTRAEERWNRFMGSVRARLRSIRIDSVLPDKADACRAEVERLLRKTQDDQPRLVRALQDAYMSARYYEVVPLNAVIRDMLEAAAEWDGAFAKFEADFLSDKDVRQLTMMQLKKIFTDESKESSATSTTTTASVVSGSDGKTTPVTTQTSMSEEVTEEKEEERVVEEKGEEGEEEKANTAPIPIAAPRPPSGADALSESVAPLDLATPDSPTLAKTRDSDIPSPRAVEGPGPIASPVSSPPPTSPTSPRHADNNNNSSNNALPPLPPFSSQTSLTEKVALLRRERRAAGGDDSRTTTTPPPVPPERISSRRSGPATSPPMLRTMSQPVVRAQSTASSRSTTRDSVGGGGGEPLRRAPTDGPAPAAKGEKKFTDRIGLGALKSRKSATPSGIPRYVHGGSGGGSGGGGSGSGSGGGSNKKRETKVSTLARHFEQLSREFEKERLKDRKQRAAKLHRSRAVLPRASTKAIVDVYDDVDQAVREPGPGDGDDDQQQQQQQQHRHQAHDDSVAAGQPSSTAAAPAQGAGDEDRTEEVAAQGQKGQKEGQDEGGRGERKDEEGGPAAADEGSDTEPSLLEDILPDVRAIADSLEPSEDIPLELPKHQKKSLMAMLTNFWAERSASGWPPLEYPVNATDHIFINSDIIVREDEPSSLIAFALSSDDYTDKLADIRRGWTKADLEEGTGAGGRRRKYDDDDGEEDEEERGDEGDDEVDGNEEAAERYEGADGDEGNEGVDLEERGEGRVEKEGEREGEREGEEEGEDLIGDDVLEMGAQTSHKLGQVPPRDESELEQSLLRPTGTHLRYQYTEGSAKMMCKIFFAEQFDALRQKCGVAERVVESLSRCLKWDSKGGKTKSVFLKTLDDRLVMKSLSPVETAAFLRFAPDYFNIMARALFHDLPSVIAKMLGFFQVVIKNPLTNTEIKLDLLVMENLFYDRSPTRIFDLKGSMRNRRIQSTGEHNEVLLDENMVEYIYESPLFAREHSKGLLRVSVWNDTLFLALQNVMDYSLMVAVDEDRKELVVGIIDCIRTYTWDKRLESWIKDRGFAGGRNRPTVTSPKEYKSRFREAMARYILQAPNSWHQFRVPQPSTPATPRTRFEDE